MAEIVSKPFRPNPEVVCERCVFGHGEHAGWCKKREPTAEERSALRRSIRLRLQTMRVTTTHPDEDVVLDLDERRIVAE